MSHDVIFAYALEMHSSRQSTSSYLEIVELSLTNRELAVRIKMPLVVIPKYYPSQNNLLNLAFLIFNYYLVTFQRSMALKKKRHLLLDPLLLSFNLVKISNLNATM